ncbi:hypothetical protein JKP88DRAFT_254938 [Tribonema minus]|uniref:Apple domain-containing protein n=1 Tax=Tribonema minus TaxID=303371 RepID=A0A835ZAR4_9STRA|nr:hypothetical protein JKP88DRAFT_254938 [Tribonema minus]
MTALPLVPATLACPQGYTGPPSCSQCAKGYGSTDGTTCVDCGPNGASPGGDPADAATKCTVCSLTVSAACVGPSADRSVCGSQYPKCSQPPAPVAGQKVDFVAGIDLNYDDPGTTQPDACRCCEVCNANAFCYVWEYNASTDTCKTHTTYYQCNTAAVAFTADSNSVHGGSNCPYELF